MMTMLICMLQVATVAAAVGAAVGEAAAVTCWRLAKGNTVEVIIIIIDQFLYSAILDKK